MLDEFIEGAVRHCAAEEELTERSQYPDRAAHKNAHKLFVRDRGALARELADSGLSAAVDEWTVIRIPEWLAFHIQTNDAALVRHLLRGSTGPRRPLRVPQAAC